MAKKNKKHKVLNAMLTEKILHDAKTGEKYEMALVPQQDAIEYRADAQKIGLLGRIMAKIRPTLQNDTSETGSQTTDTETQGSMYGDPNRAAALFESEMNPDSDRLALYEDWIKMFRRSTFAYRALKVTVANIFTSKDGDHSSYEIKSESEKVLSILTDMDKGVDMHNFAPKRCKACLKMGDFFTERVIDNKLLITRLKWLNPKYMFRNEDEFGRLIAEEAFIMKNDTTKIASFSYAQCGHMRYDHDFGSGYGKSMFFPARFPWRQGELQKKGIIIRRLSKSTKRYAYTIPFMAGTSRDEQKRVIDEMKIDLRRTSVVDSVSGNEDTRLKPILEENDIFIASFKDNPAKVEMMDPGGIQDNYEDVRMIREEELAAYGVPPAYMGVDKEVRGRAHLGWIDIEFARMLREGQKMNAKEQRKEYDLQLVLLGVPLEDDLYEVVYPPISFVDERIKMEIEELKWRVATQIRSTMGLPMHWILMNIVGLSEDEIVEIMSDEDYVKIEPGAQPPGFAGPTDSKGKEFKEGIYRNQRLLDDLMDFRDRMREVIRYGLNKEYTG